MAAKRPPELSEGAASALLLRYFPFRRVFRDSFKSLPSYDDRNLYFEGALSGTAGDGAPFVLKMLNSGVSHDTAEGMNAMMLLLSEKGIPCSRPAPTRGGDYILKVSRSELLQQLSPADAAGEMYSVRVLTFIRGVPMDKLDKKCLTPELAYSVGEMVGKVDIALQDLKHDAIFQRKFREWDLMYFTDVRQYIPHLAEEEKRKVAYSVVAMFEEHVLPVVPRMKKGVVHNDASGLNILFDVSGGKCDFCGLIDFGDSVYTCYLFELAIMLAYGMCEKDNPVEFVGPMFQGYHHAFPLDREELNCLYYSVLARLCQSMAIGEYRYTLEPWNSYLLTTPAEAWRLINLLLNLTKDRVEEVWGVWPSD